MEYCYSFWFDEVSIAPPHPPFFLEEILFQSRMFVICLSCSSLIGPFFVSVEEEGGEEERMVGVDLKKGILMEIVIDTGVTCRKYKLG